MGNAIGIKVGFMEDADAFLYSLPIKAYQKVTYNIYKIEQGIMDKEIFKKLDDTDIWEIRTLYNGIAYRLFAFWDTESGTLVVATHGIVKKTQKTPRKEIAKAEVLREAYFDSKHKK